MEIKIEFCEYWFKDKKGQIWNKAHFHINEKLTAWVPVLGDKKAGDIIKLVFGRDNEGRVKVTTSH